VTAKVPVKDPDGSVSANKDITTQRHCCPKQRPWAVGPPDLARVSDGSWWIS
jgi:hypothetical protein